MDKKMINKFKIITVILLILLSTSFSNANEIPSYDEIFTHQLKCSSDYFSDKIWDKKLPLLAVMRKDTVVVISKPTIIELSSKKLKKIHPGTYINKGRIFKVNAMSYSQFKCGSKNSQNFEVLKPESVETLVHILQPRANSTTFSIVGGESDDYEGTNPEINTDYLYYAGENLNASGMYCVVLVDDFIKNPNAINVDKLCEGKPAKDREATKKSIEQLRQALKASVLQKVK